jgi:hypothetical protein
MKRRLLCRLGKHTWRQRHTDDNQPYTACEYCDALQDGPPGGYREGGLPPGSIPSV